MNRINKLIEICRFEEDTSTWQDITSKIFNGLKYGSLCLWHKNRDKTIFRLIEEQKDSAER